MTKLNVPAKDRPQTLKCFQNMVKALTPEKYNEARQALREISSTVADSVEKYGIPLF